jgi:TPR repeat protein
MYFLQAYFKDGEWWLRVNRETNAIHSWRLAADKGSKEGLWRLGQVYSKFGFHCSDFLVWRLALPDYPRAAKYFEMSSALGHSDAQFLLAWMYDNGKGVTQSHAEATRLLLNAADSKHMNAAHMLAMRYCLGDVVKQDYSAAARIFQNLEDVVYGGLAGDLVRRGILKGWEFQPIPSIGYDDVWLKCDVSFQLGLLYVRGDGVIQNYAKAASHFRNGPRFFDRNSSPDNRNGQDNDYELGLLYFDGLGVEQDYKMAIKLLGFEYFKHRTSSSDLYTLCMNLKLGELYLKLNLIEEAVHQFRFIEYYSTRPIYKGRTDYAAASILAAKFLTDINIKGEGTGQDHVEAARLFKFVAAKLGTKSAQRSCATALPPISYPFCICGSVDLCNFGPCRYVCSLCQVEDIRLNQHTCGPCYSWLKVTRP